MVTEESKDKFTSAIEAATGLVKAIPLYDDAIQPAAKQVGKSLETLGKAVNMALAPLQAMVWGYSLIEKWLTNKVQEKLKDVETEKIVTPLLQIAGPTVESLRYVANNETLRELYANLLATAMNQETLHMAHPAYVEIIKNLSTDEATILQLFEMKDAYPTLDLEAYNDRSDYSTHYTNFSPFHNLREIQRIDLIPSYINNLCRLGLIEQPPKNLQVDDPDDYTSLLNDPFLDKLKAEIRASNQKAITMQRGVFITPFGRQFVDNVVCYKTLKDIETQST